ncbi:hypothetical protein D3C81_2074490 [compost metagenome]
MTRRWPIEHIPGSGGELVAIALLEAVAGLDLAADGFFEHLRLAPFVVDADQ